VRQSESGIQRFSPLPHAEYENPEADLSPNCGIKWTDRIDFFPATPLGFRRFAFGDTSRVDAALDYLCRIQDEGGWLYGGYGRGSTYERGRSYFSLIAV
jgi:hypothetical protein